MSIVLFGNQLKIPFRFVVDQDVELKVAGSAQGGVAQQKGPPEVSAQVRLRRGKFGQLRRRRTSTDGR